MRRWVICSICGNYYALESTQVISVEYGRAEMKLENVPAYVEGVSVFRGAMMPLIKVRGLFDMNRIPEPEMSQIVYMNCAGDSIGFRFDSVAEISELPDETCQKIPVVTIGDKNAYIKGVLKHNGKLVALLDHNSLIMPKDRKAIADALNVLRKKEEEARAEEERIAAAKAEAEKKAAEEQN